MSINTWKFKIGYAFIEIFLYICFAKNNNTNMEVILILIGLFFLHWIGDFIFQSRKVAENKSTSIKYLTIHVCFYTLTFLPIFFLIGGHINFVYFVLSLFSLHWITDFLTSKITGYFWKKKKVKAFFTTIGFDQFLHAVQILLLYHIFIAEIVFI